MSIVGLVITLAHRKGALKRTLPLGNITTNSDNKQPAAGCCVCTCEEVAERTCEDAVERTCEDAAKRTCDDAWTWCMTSASSMGDLMGEYLRGLPDYATEFTRSDACLYSRQLPH